MSLVPIDNAESSSVLPRLRQSPDWLYLMREYYNLYLQSSAGGSAKIRSHQRIVREEISRAIESNPPLRLGQPTTKPVCAHLKRALDQGRLQPTARVIAAVDSVTDHLTWQYGYERLPKHLADKYAYADIVGPNGPVVHPNLVLGLVLFAPKCVYPTHKHEGISESYFCLSGSVSENDYGVYAPGSMIFNPPGHSHRITVADREPCLLAYAWAGDADKLAGQQFKFSRMRTT